MEHKRELWVIERLEGEPVIVEGSLNQENVNEFESQMRAIQTGQAMRVTLDLCGLDIEDGLALVTAINSLRELRARAGGVVLKGAPQMLGHNLYRARMLEGSGAIELVDMRHDEAG